jgi:hypothetical protein
MITQNHIFLKKKNKRKEEEEAKIAPIKLNH